MPTEISSELQSSACHQCNYLHIYVVHTSKGSVRDDADTHVSPTCGTDATNVVRGEEPVFVKQ